MASIQAKIGWKMMRKRENKNSPSVSSLPDGSHKIPKKKKKKLKNTIMGSFQSKIRRRRVRKTKNKNYCSDPFLPDP